MREEEYLDSLNGGEMDYTGSLGTPGLKLQNPEVPFGSGGLETEPQY